MEERKRREPEASSEPREPMQDSWGEFDLPAHIEALRREDPYQRGRNSKTLWKYPDLRIVLTVLKAGARMTEHKTASRISVQTVRGHVRMQVREKQLDLPLGHMLVLDPDIPHDVEAIEDSAFLLTLGPANFSNPH